MRCRPPSTCASPARSIAASTSMEWPVTTTSATNRRRSRSRTIASTSAPTTTAFARARSTGSCSTRACSPRRRKHGRRRRAGAWLRAELTTARSSGLRHIVVFQHHSWFLENADEPAQYFNVPVEPGRKYLDLLKSAGVRYVFAGHYHRNASGRDGDLEMITSGPVGRPLGSDPSGIRIVTVAETGLVHTYFGFGSIPNQFPPAAPAGRGAATPSK